MERRFSGTERRRFRRVEKEFTVKLRVYPKDKIVLRGAHDAVFVRNIGAGGMLIKYGKKMEAGRFVDLDMKFPGMSEPVRCLGKIVRVEQAKQQNSPGEPVLYNIAVRFIETIDKKERDMIAKVVEENYPPKHSDNG